MNQATAKPAGLTRSIHDRVLAGVVGGIAHRFGWSPTVLRVVYVLPQVQVTWVST